MVVHHIFDEGALSLDKCSLYLEEGAVDLEDVVFYKKEMHYI